jgi:hypothetical protein
MGTIGMFLLFGVFGTRFYFVSKHEEPSRMVYMTLAIVSTGWAFISMIMAFVFNAGLSQTCKEFEKSGKSCGAVFGEGFFEGDTQHIYYKNINTINAALGI